MRTCPGQRREPSCASLGLCWLEEGEGRAGRRGGDAEGRRRRRLDGWLGSRSFSLPAGKSGLVSPLPLTTAP